MSTSTPVIAKPDLIAGMAKGLAVLESFDTERQRLNATLAAQRAGLSRAAARRHLLTLAYLGYLETDGSYFWLSPKVLRFSGSYLSSARLPRTLQPTLNRLASQNRASFSAVVLDGDEVVIVANSGQGFDLAPAAATRLLAYGLHLGARLPAYATSTGRVLLADMPRAGLNAWFKGRRLPRLTAHTVTQVGVLRALLGKAGPLAFVFRDRAGDELLLRAGDIGGCARWRNEPPSPPFEMRDERGVAPRLKLAGQQPRRRRRLIRPGERRIELDQQLPGGDVLSVADVDRADIAQLDRLDHLDAAGGDDFAGGGGDDIDFADDRPRQRDGEQDADRQHQPAQPRARRLFHDLERGGEKFVIAARFGVGGGFCLEAPRRAQHVDVAGQRRKTRRQAIAQPHSVIPVCLVYKLA